MMALSWQMIERTTLDRPNPTVDVVLSAPVLALPVSCLMLAERLVLSKETSQAAKEKHRDNQSSHSPFPYGQRRLCQPHRPTIRPIQSHSPWSSLRQSQCYHHSNQLRCRKLMSWPDSFVQPRLPQIEFDFPSFSESS